MKPTIAERESPRKATAAPSEVFEVVDLGPFDNNRNDVLALNNTGQYAGVTLNEVSGRIEAFRQENGKRTMLGTLGGAFSIARDINDRGEVVGGSLTEGDENFHGFIYRNQKLYDLNEFLEPDGGWELIQALGINNRGEIIGIGASEGQDRIVLLRPKT
jgi:probable HAF family extracellular repeat protein